MLQTKALQYSENGVDKEINLTWDTDSVKLDFTKRSVELELLKADMDSMVYVGAIVYSLRHAGIPVAYLLSNKLAKSLSNKLVPKHNIKFAGISVLYLNNKWSAGDIVLHTQSKKLYTYAQLLYDMVGYVIIKTEKFAPQLLK